MAVSQLSRLFRRTSGHESLSLFVRLRLNVFILLPPGVSVVTRPVSNWASIPGRNARRCITWAHKLKTAQRLFLICAPTRDRTWDLLLKRELLYRLSYRRIFYILTLRTSLLNKGEVHGMQFTRTG